MLIDNDQDENDGVAIRFSIYQSISLKDLLECIRNTDDEKVATMIMLTLMMSMMMTKMMLTLLMLNRCNQNLSTPSTH